MPSWLIVILVLAFILMIGIVAIAIAKGKSQAYQELISKNYLEIIDVVNDTIKLKVKFWKRHESRNQPTIFLQKTYKNTIEQCFLDFYDDLSLCEELTAREQSALSESLDNFLVNYSKEYPFCDKIINWINEYRQSEQNTNQNLNVTHLTEVNYVANKIDLWIESKHKVVKKQISKNNGFRSLKDFINEYRNCKEKNTLVPGIYVIWNKTKNLYYVGQAYNIYKRITSGHFDINGNCRNLLFYDDYNNGDEFFVSFIKCDRSELNKMEKETIRAYSPNVYNKTKGNI